MKKLFLILTFTLAALATPSFAQQDTVSVDVTKLNSDQLRVYQQMKAMQNQTAAATAIENLTPEKIDRYAQMGHGLGVAVKEGLSAVTTNVEQFCQTGAGKWLMVLITWKVMGNDAIDLTRTLIQWGVGSFLLLVGIPFWIWLVKRNCVNRPIQMIEKIGFWGKKVVYTDRSPIHDAYILAYGACFLIYLGATAAIMFAH